jgi:hypothetical protein
MKNVNSVSQFYNVGEVRKLFVWFFGYVKMLHQEMRFWSVETDDNVASNHKQLGIQIKEKMIF